MILLKTTVTKPVMKTVCVVLLWNEAGLDMRPVVGLEMEKEVGGGGKGWGGDDMLSRLAAGVRTSTRVNKCQGTIVLLG